MFADAVRMLRQRVTATVAVGSDTVGVTVINQVPWLTELYKLLCLRDDGLNVNRKKTE